MSVASKHSQQLVDVRLGAACVALHKRNRRQARARLGRDWWRRARLTMALAVVLGLLAFAPATTRAAAPLPPAVISAGFLHTCALTPAGAADCWGDNTYGQVDDQPGPYVPAPRLSNASVAEHQPAGTAVGTLPSTDAVASSGFTYALVSGTGDTDNASFTISGTTLKTAAPFDYETRNSYSVRVRSTDRYGFSSEQVFTVTVTDVQENVAPVANNDSFSTNEDTALAIRPRVEVVHGDADGGYRPLVNIRSTIYLCRRREHPEAIGVSDALWCGACKPQPEPVEMPEMY